MVAKGFSTDEWRRALAETEEEEEKEDAQQILQPLSNLKINEEECGWDVFTEEILPRVSANQLQTLKSVCKNWNRTISSPYFAVLHLKIYKNQSRFRVLKPRFTGMTEYKIGSDEETEQQILYPPAIRTRESRILGSCDGLLCLLLRAKTGTRRNHSIAVYNPSTAKYFCLQSPLKHDYKIYCSWFGQHLCSGEYILVLGSLDDEIGVYKFNNRRSNLKKIHSTFSCCIQTIFFYEHRVGTLLHGALHWPVKRDFYGSQVICSYHLDENKYFEFSPPLQLEHVIKLGVADGCLFAFFRAADYAACVYELWIMKEYKLQQSWTKCASIQAEGFNDSRVLFPLGFSPNANLILYPNKLGLINYTFNDNKTLLLIYHDYDYGSVEAIMCADSLVCPEIVGT